MEAHGTPTCSHGHPLSQPGRAFRVSSIPVGVSHFELNHLLETLPYLPERQHTAGPNIHTLSLVSNGHGGAQTAIVVFHVVPTALEECKEQRLIQIILQSKESTFRVEVDCHFQGMTCIYNGGDKVIVEYVTNIQYFSRGLTYEQYNSGHRVGRTCIWILEEVKRMHYVVEGSSPE